MAWNYSGASLSDAADKTFSGDVSAPGFVRWPQDSTLLIFFTDVDLTLHYGECHSPNSHSYLTHRL